MFNTTLLPLLALLASILGGVVGKRHNPTRSFSTSISAGSRTPLSTIKPRTTMASSNIVTSPTSTSTLSSPPNATTHPAAGSVNWSQTGVVVPLYMYPNSDSTWAPLITAIKNNPTLPFYVIINPHTGPGDADSQPDSNYATYLPALLAAPNAKFIGYVSTQYGNRDPSAVQTDITTYSKWDAQYALHGIFFDETEDGKLEQYTGYSNAAKTAFGQDAFIIVNPGSAVSDSYYSIANQIITFEHDYTTYTTATLPTSNAHQQGILIYSLPGGDATVLKTVVEGLKGKKVGSLYVTDLQLLAETDVWAGFGSLFDELVQDVAGEA